MAGFFFGNIMRRDGLEPPTTIGKLEGKQGKGRQIKQMIESLAAWMNIEKTTSVISPTSDQGT